ncbi:hypothetical protein L249_4042 [Ophiocordyceps polyrhachis-furcata BCC 54312]|uniref:Myb-like domain-containing protein n=1 Tax=Ophiocordyceps polyrhachis-furcata BCC 54312 TaxID=1330021 RepID=A0A367L570_9HYPO|nr:hypothetical protein L249_4042 [Ophiocordyceps polyrhachis-furcata BCC 54312]
MSQEVTPSKGNPWTEEAKIQFLLRIISQLREDGRTINWSRLGMEGRTTKSLQNMWTKITKEIAEMEARDAGEGSVGTPSKSKATREGTPVGSLPGGTIPLISFHLPAQKTARKPKKSEAWVAANGGLDSEDESPKKRAACEFIRCREQEVVMMIGGRRFVNVGSTAKGGPKTPRKKTKRSDSDDEEKSKGDKDDY